MSLRPDRQRILPLALACAYGATALAVSLAFFPIGDLGVESDYYGELGVAARKLWAGEFSVLNYPYKGPLTSFALVLVRPVARLAGMDWYRTGVLLNAICAALGLWLTWRLLRRAGGARLAAWGAVSVGLAYEYFLHAHKGSSDLLFFVLFVATVDLLAREGWSVRRLLGAGVLAGLAYLTRYNGLILPAAAVVILPLADPGRWGGRRRWLGGLLVVAGFALTAAPWFLAGWLETGRPLATRHLQNIFVEEFYAGAARDTELAAAVSTLPRLVLHDPLHFLRGWLGNLPAHFRLDLRGLVGPALAVLVVLGLLRLLLVRIGRTAATVLLFSLAYFLAMALVYHQPRFFLPLLPGYALLAWSAVLGTGREESPRHGGAVPRALAVPVGLRAQGRAVAIALLVVVSALQARVIVTGERYYHARRPLFVLAEAERLRELAARRGLATVMARKPHLAFYAGLEHRPYPPRPGSRSDLVAFALASGADVIAVSEIERIHYPDLDYLDYLDDAAGVTRLFQDDRIILYGLDRSLAPAAAAASTVVADLAARRDSALARDDVPAALDLAYRIGLEEMTAREWERAAAALEGAVALAERHPGAAATGTVLAMRLNLALSLLRAGRPGEGVDALSSHLEEFAAEGDIDRLANAHVLLARNLEALGREQEALSSLRRAREVLAAAGRDARVRALDAEIRARTAPR